MVGRKVATTVYLTPEQDSRLKKVHLRTRLAVAELVRQGVDLVLERYADALVADPVADAKAAVFVQQPAGSPQHLLAGLAGKGEEENGLGRDALLDQMGDAIHQRSGLAAAGTGNDQYRACGSGYRRVLRLVELLQIHYPRYSSLRP